MNQTEIEKILQLQRKFFATGATLDVEFRTKALKKLHRVIRENESRIAAALKLDLGKSPSESYMCETGLALSEISYMISHVRSFSRDRWVPTPLAQFHSHSFRRPSPYGTVLVMSPWNYPFLLSIDPLADAIAAGNTVVLKPSAYSPHTSKVIEEILTDCFPQAYVAVVTGGRAENTYLLDAKFDYIFFTGSQVVGREVMRKASSHLTPVTLELGGKSPCIVEKTADLKLAARRIVFGKYLNCGQTCVAPDYLYCEASVKDALLEEIKREIRRQYGEDPLANPDYGNIINRKHFERISGLIDADKVIFGGEKDAQTLQIAPTVMDGVTFDDAVMGEEIFGPVLPVITFDSIDEVIARVNSGAHPLALYIFTSDKEVSDRVTAECTFGGGCVNDTVIHLATSHMPFGGVGESGMGAYHGKVGFETFSHFKSICDKKTWLDLPMRYQPYKKAFDLIVKLVMR